MILSRHLTAANPWFQEAQRLFQIAGSRFLESSPIRVLSHHHGWILAVDAPGVSREEITLETRDGHLHLTIQHEGAFPLQLQHRLPLGSEIDPTAIRARLTDGVLTIDLPKRQDNQPSAHRIEIQG